jgi:hypothetical protein
VSPRESRRTGRLGRVRNRPDLAPLECLEGRQLLAYSPLGFSLPDLIVSGTSSPLASYGRDISVTVDVQNIGASSIIEPLALLPGAVSTADAPPSTVGVFLTPRQNSLRGAIRIGTINVPFLRQNSLVRITQNIPLPLRPGGFPGNGGRVFLNFQANADNSIIEADAANNRSSNVALRIAPARGDVQVVRFDVPPIMQPGDTIRPSFVLTNNGAVETGAGPNEVLLVGSRSRRFQADTQILARYSFGNIPVGGNVTIEGDPVRLPANRRVFFIGVLVGGRNTGVRVSRQVGPPIADLPPAGALVDVSPTPPQFPFPAGIAGDDTVGT